MIPTSLPIHPFLMVAVFGLPLALGIGLSTKRWQPAIIRLAPWSALPALAAVIWVPSDEIVSIPWILLEMHLAMDPTGRLFSTVYFAAVVVVRDIRPKLSGIGSATGTILLFLSSEHVRQLRLDRVPGCRQLLCIFCPHELCILRPGGSQRRQRRLAGRPYLHLFGCHRRNPALYGVPFAEPGPLILCCCRISQTYGQRQSPSVWS